LKMLRFILDENRFFGDQLSPKKAIYTLDSDKYSFDKLQFNSNFNFIINNQFNYNSMKTKFTLFIIFNLCIYGFSFSQNTGENGNPDSLNVTINDTTQNLQVNGSIVVDSSLTVKDSVIMEDNLHIYEKLRLENDANLQKDVYIGNTLKVEGESYFNGDAFFNEKVFLNALDTLDSLAIASFADSMSVIEKPSVLFVDENGAVQKGNADILKSIIYTGKFCTETIGSDGLPILVTNPPDPTWENGPNSYS